MLKDEILEKTAAGGVHRVDWPMLRIYFGVEGTIDAVEKWTKENGVQVLWDGHDTFHQKTVTGATFLKAK